MTDLNNYLIIAMLLCSASKVISSDKENVCQLPIDEGDCESDSLSSSEERNITVVYGYNSNSTKCEQFIYEGCDGNKNRFQTGNDCWRTCYTPLNYFLARVAELISIRVSALEYAASKNTTHTGKTTYTLPEATVPPIVSNSGTVATTSDPLVDDSNDGISGESINTTTVDVQTPS